MKRYGVVLAASGLGMLLNAGDVTACGGDFTPPTTVQVVTDHRMVLSLSSMQSTLWDQFDYTGDPSDFSWILPLHYSSTVRVEIGTEAFMQMADNLTAPQVTVPVAPGGNCFDNAGEAPGTAASSDAGAIDAGVTVDLQEVVGPYDVSIISGTDPTAITTWLTSHGYMVPPSVAPVISYYTAMSMDFVALRLRPTAGVSQMSPIRITVPSYMSTLPLRMISAGVSDKVGLSLIVLAPSRIEAQNFPNGVVTPSELTYDFNHPTDPSTDFINAFEGLNTAAGGRLWLTESSTTQYAADWTSQVSIFNPGGPFDSDAGSLADGGAPASPVDDVSTAFGPIGSSAIVTRLRADLGVAQLNQDLSLQASDLGMQARQYTYGVVLHTPAPMTCENFDAGSSTGSDGGTGTSVDAGGNGIPPIVAPGTHSTGGIQCTAAPWGTGTSHRDGSFFAIFAAVGLVTRRRSRR